MLKTLVAIGQSKWYWLGFILLGITLEAVALYYQYILDEWPCVVCIHVRLLIMGGILVALMALLFNSRQLRNIAHVLTALLMLGLLERSWMLLGVERGFIFGGCSMETGLPSWFSPDKWFPFIFEIQTTCGYTPELWFGVTMAEGLLALSVVLLLTSSVLAFSGFMRSKTE